MRTTIFNDFAGMHERFKEDFDTLWGLSAEQRHALIPHVSRIFQTRQVGQHKIATDAAVSDIGGESGDILKALSILLYIHREWRPYRDTSEDFLRDLAELRIIPEEKTEEASLFLRDFLAAVEQDNKRRMEQSTTTSMLPYLKGCDTLVDFRAVIRNPFGTGLDDRVDKYEPHCISLVPVVLVNVKRDSGDPTSFQFQCIEEDLDVLIEALQAANKELQAARVALRKGGGES